MQKPSEPRNRHRPSNSKNAETHTPGQDYLSLVICVGKSKSSNLITNFFWEETETIFCILSPLRRLAVLCAEARPSSLHWTQGHPCQSPLCRTSGSRTPQRAFHWVVRPPRAHSSHGTTTKASPYSRRAANGTHRARMRTRPIDDWLQRWRSLRPLAAARRRLSVRCTIGIEPPSFDAVAPGPGRRAYLWDSCRPPIRHRSRVLSPRASVRSGRAARDGHWHPFSTAEP